jgi:hypothetical protein
MVSMHLQALPHAPLVQQVVIPCKLGYTLWYRSKLYLMCWIWNCSLQELWIVLALLVVVTKRWCSWIVCVSHPCTVADTN